MKRWCAVALVVLVGCSGSVTHQTLPRPSISVSDPSPTPERRGALEDPPGVIVVNDASGISAARVERAQADLKNAGMWRKLTKHLYRIEFVSAPGRSFVPDDGHLAEAYKTFVIEDGTGGTLCQIKFFSTAMRDDLNRWINYHAQGLIPEEPPSFRHFWAAIMAHELAHCLDGPNGEKAALEWEERALEAIRATG